MSDEIAEAAAFYLWVCQEHDRAFPLRNILVASVGHQTAEDKERFIADVREHLLADARRRLEEAVAQIAAERRFGGPDVVTTEIEIASEATALVAAARLGRATDRATDREPDDGSDPAGD